MMNSQRSPTLHPLSMLPMLARAVDGQVAALLKQRRQLEEMLQMLSSVDNASLNQMSRILGETDDVLSLYAQQVENWFACAPSQEQELQVDAVGQKVIFARKTVSTILTLISELKRNGEFVRGPEQRLN